MAEPTEPTYRPRVPALAVLGPAVLAGALMVFGLLQLRPDRGAERADTLRLVNLFVDPAGYQVLGDDEARAGSVPVEGAGAMMSNVARLDSGDLPGYVIGHVRAWGRPPGQPPRGVLVFVSEYETERDAGRVRDQLRDRQAPVTSPTGVTGIGGSFRFTDGPDDRGRHFERVVFSRGPLLYVVSVVTPDPDPGSPEVVQLARQYAAA